MSRQSDKKLSIHVRISTNYHQQLKVMAAVERTTIKSLVTAAIVERYSLTEQRGETE